MKISENNTLKIVKNCLVVSENFNNKIKNNFFLKRIKKKERFSHYTDLEILIIVPWSLLICILISYICIVITSRNMKSISKFSFFRILFPISFFFPWFRGGFIYFFQSFFMLFLLLCGEWVAEGVKKWKAKKEICFF